MKLSRIKILLAAAAIMFFVLAAMANFLPFGVNGANGAEDNLFSFETANWDPVPNSDVVEYGFEKDDPVHGKVFSVKGIGSGALNGVYKADIDFVAGRTYTLTYWLKTSPAVSDNMRFSPIIQASAFETLRDGAVKDPAGGTLKLGRVVVPEWKKYTTEYVAKENYAGYIGFEYYLSWAPDDAIYLADISITSEGEILPNGHFEGVSGWTGIDESDVVSGVGAAVGNSLKLEKSAGESITVKNDPVTENLVDGEKYTLSFRYRNSALFKGGAQGEVYFENAQGEKIEQTAVTLKATNEVYNEGRVDFTADADCKDMRLVISLWGDGEVSYTFSDFSLDEYEDLIANGDFSAGLDGWYVNGTDAKSTVSVKDDDTFGKVLALEKAAGAHTATLITWATAKPSAKLETGRKYVLSFNYKLTGAAGEVNSQMTMRGPSASIIFNCSQPTNEWEYFSYEFFVNEGFESATFEPRLVGRAEFTETATAYFADVKLTPTDEYTDTGILNGNFTATTNAYPDYFGIIGDCGKAEGNSVHISKTALIEAGGLSMMTSVYGGYEHKISFAFKGNAEAREGLKIRVTPYADRERTPLANVESKFLDFDLADNEKWQTVEALYDLPEETRYADISIYVQSDADADFYVRTPSNKLSSYEALINLGFELGGTGWTSTAGAITEDDNVKAGLPGEHTARIDNVTNGNVRSSNINILPGKTYEVSYWMNADLNDAAFAYMRLSLFTADGSPSNIYVYDGKAANEYPYYAFTNTYTPPWIYRVYGKTANESNPEGWVNSRHFFTAGDDAAYVVFSLEIALVDGQRGHTIWLDEVSVTEYDNVPNLDFENVTANGVPVGWYASTSQDRGFEFKAVNDVYHSGKTSMYLKTETLLTPQSIVSSALIPVNPEGKKCIYEVSFWVSSKNSDYKSVQLDLWYYDRNGLKICSPSVDSIVSPTVGVKKTLNSGSERSEWSYVYTRFNVSHEAVFMAPVFTFTEGKAEIWLDDVTVKQVENDDTVIVAQNDFHAVDERGNISGWSVTDASFNACETALVHGSETVNDAAVNYGRLVSESGSEYMRYTVKTIETAYEYVLELAYRSESAVSVELRFSDFMHREYENRRQVFEFAPSNGWRSERITFVSPSCTYLDVMLRNPQGGTLDAAGITIYRGSSSKADMTWSASWINYISDFRWSKENSSIYYRKTVDLTGLEAVYAPLQFTADDQVALYVNGNLVLSTIGKVASSWAEINKVDLTEYLVSGKNVLAIEAYNQGAYAGMLFDGIWTVSDGETEHEIYCISDGETLCYADSEFSDTAWTETDFDDSAWRNSVVLGNPPMNPWGSLYFDSALYVDNRLEVEVPDDDGEVDEVTDLVYEFTMRVRPEEKIEKEVPFTFVLWRKNSITSYCSVTPTILEGPPMTEWKAGEWTTLKLQVQLPDYIDTGNYSLQLADTYFLITNADIADNKFVSFKVYNNYESREVVSKVEVVNGTPTLIVNGEPMPNVYFTTPTFNTEATYGSMGKSGLETYVNYEISLGDGDNMTNIYKENGSLDLAFVDNAVNSILAASPTANLIFTVRMQAPYWWMDQHPGERTLTSDINGNLYYKHGNNVSMASTLWRDEASELLTEIIEHIKEQVYYSRIVGLRINFGQTAEWFPWGGDGAGYLADYSDAAQNYFKEYAQKKYGTIEKVREAWGDDSLTSFDDIKLPTYREFKREQNGVPSAGLLYDPIKDRKLIDARQILGEMTGDLLLHWAKVAKEASDYKLVVGAYYGYLFIGSNYDGARVSHPALERVLESDLIDFFASPVGYNERQIGEGRYLQAVTDTIMSYGKLVIAEQDNRTVLTGLAAGTGFDSRDYAVGTTHTMEDTIKQLKRDVAFNIADGHAQWFYDMFGGWFDDDQLYEYMTALNDELTLFNYLQKDTVNEVALIMPDLNHSYLGVTDATDGNGLYSHQTVISQSLYTWHRKALDKMGAGYDVYALSTLVSGNMPRHKVNIFFSPYMFSEAERAAIDKYCKNNGQINVFFYLSGYGDESGYDFANMTELTGFEFGMNTGGRYAGQIKVTNGTSPITEGALGSVFGAKNTSVNYLIHEMYVKPTPGVTVLGNLVGSNEAGFAVKDMGDWSSIYCSAPLISAEIYRNILEMADVHIYSENASDIVHANSAYIAVHSASSGIKTIKLTENRSVYDVFEKRYLDVKTGVDKDGETFYYINYYNDVDDTHLFRLTEPNTVTFLNIVKGGNGSITDNGLQQLAAGGSKQVTVTPDEGYMIDSIVINGKEHVLQESDWLSSYTIYVDGQEEKICRNYKLVLPEIDENTEVVVRFKRIPVQLEQEIYNVVNVPDWVLIVIGAVALGAAVGIIVFVKARKGRKGGAR